MGLIRDLRPTNLAQEREKFFDDAEYNPQFTYVREFTPEEMSKYGPPNEQYFKHAKKMLDQFGPPQPVTDPHCTPEQIEAEIVELFANLQLPPLEVNFTEKLTSQVLIHPEGITFRLPIKYGHESLKNKLNHEIQTHYLRKNNQKLQSWPGTDQELYPRQFRATEEGLANLHSYVDRGNPLMTKTYLTYFAAYRATEVSFSQLFNELVNYGISERFAWNLTLKQKRGLKDTSKPGGYSKNHVYFEGAVSVWNWLRSPGNDLRQLYQGRLSLSDADKLSESDFHPDAVYPTFYQHREKYYQFLEKLGDINQLQNLPDLYHDQASDNHSNL